MAVKLVEFLFLFFCDFWQKNYTFSTNREKVAVLKWIVAQPEFTELLRFSTAENKIYTLYTNQYDEILKTGEIPNNLQIKMIWNVRK